MAEKLRLGVLFSGGKDSTLALQKATEFEQVVCLISLQSMNKESYMFHTPNISLVSLQAEALGLPIVLQQTAGEKEAELEDLEAAISRAITEHSIQGVVTGAVESVYQAERVQRICKKLGIWCFNPLWQKDQIELLRELVGCGYEVIISGVFAFPLDESYLGKRLDADLIERLSALRQKYAVSPSGEGGEIETTVLDGPLHKKRIVVEESKSHWDGRSGFLEIVKAGFEEGSERNTLAKNQSEISQAVSGNKVLLVSTCSRKLSELEFVWPIRKAVLLSCNECDIIGYEEIGQITLDSYGAIIICGNAVMDNSFIEGDFSWVKSVKVPVLGICAGLQAMCKEFGAPMENNFFAGMQRIESGSDGFLNGVTEAYFMHSKAPKVENIPDSLEILSSDNGLFYAFKVRDAKIYGVLFHPEVRNASVIENFLKVANLSVKMQNS